MIPKAKAVGTAVAQSSTKEELLILRQRYDKSVSNWNKVFDVLTIFSQWVLNEKDKLAEDALNRENVLNARLKSKSEESSEFMGSWFIFLSLIY